MKVMVLHDAVLPSAPPDAQDTLVQVAAVSSALRELGHTVTSHAIAGDLAALKTAIAAEHPDLVFNLVESLLGSDAAAVGAAAVLDGVGVPYTGSSAAVIAISNDKCAAKALLTRLGLPTPEWLAAGPAPATFRAGRYIIKARFEHASVGLEADSITEFTDAAALRCAVADASRHTGRPCFGERFIDGREFNLSLLADTNGVQLLPPAEIDFSAFPAGQARLVGYRAKWDDTSFEYHNTPRRFDFATADAALLERLAALSRATWDALQLDGYVRIDFRVDAEGPWILEVNTNPCIAPDAGFVAALDRAGVTYNAAIGRIMRAALKDN